MAGAKDHNAEGIVFVTNQEISLGEREEWERLDQEFEVDLFHLLTVTQILNEPEYVETLVTEPEIRHGRSGTSRLQRFSVANPAMSGNSDSGSTPSSPEIPAS
jgi:hypothetical protein